MIEIQVWQCTCLGKASKCRAKHHDDIGFLSDECEEPGIYYVAPYDDLCEACFDFAQSLRPMDVGTTYK